MDEPKAIGLYLTDSQVEDIREGKIIRITRAKQGRGTAYHIGTKAAFKARKAASKKIELPVVAGVSAATVRKVVEQVLKNMPKQAIECPTPGCDFKGRNKQSLSQHVSMKHNGRPSNLPHLRRRQEAHA